MKKNIVILITIMFILISFLVATYAYFIAQGGTTSNSSVRVQTSTTDSLSFSVGSSINLTADQTSFASGKGNITGSTTATALLTANNATNKATSHYYLYLDISKNELNYTTSSKTAELLLTVTDAAGKTVTSLDGLNYVTSGGVSGFDITTSTGIIKLADNYEISASPTKTDTWKVTVTLVNLNSDQTANSGKTVTATLIIQKDIMNTLAEHVMDLYTADGENNLYYHTSNLANSAEDNSYRYAGASTEVNNFVCFASTAITCPEDNLYRIIGVFGGKVKLVKYTEATSTLLGTDGDYSSGNNYFWNYKNNTTINEGNGSNDWSTSLLNKTNLNKNFLNNIGTDWASKISYTDWYAKGGKWNDIAKVTLHQSYINERSNPETYNAKVGMIYVSDYGYAALPSYWSLNVSSGSATNAEDIRQGKDSNWLFNKLNLWTIVPDTATLTYQHHIMDTGYVWATYTRVARKVLPTFYLNYNVLYTGGDGTSSSPFRIK